MNNWKYNILLMLKNERYELSDIMNYIQNNLPSKLYRYRNFNDYTYNEILNETIFLSSPLNFNDPLDSLPRTYQNIDSGVYAELINGWVNISSQKLEKARGDLGVACFCESCNNFLMWSHYANNHKGCCIEYDAHKLYNLITGKLFPVLYLKKQPYYTYQKKSIFQSIIIKDEIWSYEQEWRIIYSNKDIRKSTRLIHISDCITALYAGIMCKGENLDFLYDVSEKNNIDLKFIELNNNYQLVPKDF